MVAELETVESKDFVKQFTVGDGISSSNAAWSFGGDTANYFEQHVARSVPYYTDGHDLILALSDFFIKRDSVAYELGCSTGALTRRLAKRHGANARWVGLDIESNMIAKAQEYIKNEDCLNVEYKTASILTHEYEKSDFIVSYYTLQFIPPHVRQTVFNLIFDTLHWGAVFILFENR